MAVRQLDHDGSRANLGIHLDGVRIAITLEAQLNKCSRIKSPLRKVKKSAA